MLPSSSFVQGYAIMYHTTFHDAKTCRRSNSHEISLRYLIPIVWFLLQIFRKYFYILLTEIALLLLLFCL
jgi:hypothetical protein